MATPANTLSTTINADEVKAKSWLLAHERLIVVVLCLLSFLFVANKYLSHEAEKDNAAAVQAQSILTAQQATDKALAAQVAQTQAQYQALVVQLSQQNAQLAASIQTRTVVLQQQQTVDKTLPLPALSTRWTQLANLQPNDLTATPDGVTVTDAGARSTVEELEKVPTLTQDVADGQTENANLQKELDASNVVSKDLTTQVSALNTTIVDKDKACTTELTAAKAVARKGKLKAFLYGIGVGAGAVTALVVHALL